MVVDKTKGSDESFRTFCGEVVKAMAELCPKCGVRQRGRGWESLSMPMLQNVLIGLFGFLGVSHLVNGPTGSGILFMVGGLVTGLLFWATIRFGIGLIFIPLYFGLWIWSIVNIKNTR
jgi:hypothetical protein